MVSFNLLPPMRKLENQTKLTVNVKKWERFVDEPNHFELFHIHVKRSDIETPWTVARTATQCLELDSYLGAMVGQQLASFPRLVVPKRWFGNNSDEAVEDRRIAVEKYIQALVEVKEVLEDPSLWFFLELGNKIIENDKNDTYIRHHVVIPLPDRDFDVTEVAVPWKILTNSGVRVTFATESGNCPRADDLLIRPKSMITRSVCAAEEAKLFYYALQKDDSFVNPIIWSDIDVSQFSGILLPGGHSPGMCQYLESQVLQTAIGAFTATEGEGSLRVTSQDEDGGGGPVFEGARVVAAICHGVLLLARSTNPVTNRSPVWDKQVTTLTHSMENAAYFMTSIELGRTYRTYEVHCQDEVCSFMKNEMEQFQRGPRLGLGKRGTFYDRRPAFVVVDGSLVTSRWPGDAYEFGQVILRKLQLKQQKEAPTRGESEDGAFIVD